ncbi:hypothetical protein DUGA2_40120 [Duganella sp. HH101]|nr:hypothetical protein DUGA2_40120 [Duganella sp. HH101]
MIPRVLAKEVQVGHAHAVTKADGAISQISQSGIFDPEILCGPCDEKLGLLEEKAAQLLTTVRNQAKGLHEGAIVKLPQRDDDLLRFYAALLWKYSVTRPEFGRVDLGKFQEPLRAVSFGSETIPEFLDVALFRLRLDLDDTGVFAYRAPSPDRKHGINLYRILVGGVLALVKIDRRPWADRLTSELGLRGRGEVRVAVAAAKEFEEFKMAQKLAHTKPKISTFLDKQDNVALNT